jgi:hypothetical protein
VLIASNPTTPSVPRPPTAPTQPQGQASSGTSAQSAPQAGASTQPASSGTPAADGGAGVAALTPPASSGTPAAGQAGNVPSAPAVTVTPEAVAAYTAKLSTNDGCFAAMTTQTAEGGVALDAFADKASTAAALKATVRQHFQTDVPVVANTIAQVQCSAVDFAHDTVAAGGSTPATMAMLLASPEVGPNANLRVSLRGDAGNPIYLLSVSNDGTVEFVGTFKSEDAIDSPVTPEPNSVGRTQLLVSVSAPQSLGGFFARMQDRNNKVFAAFRNQMGGLEAGAFFDALREELAKTGIKAKVAIAAFRVN